MKKFFSYLWQLPQSILAWIMMIVLRIKYGKPEKELYNGVMYRWYKDWRNGISLGNNVLLGTIYQRLDIVKHEWGHTRQSRKQGWLYLLLTGAPSGLANLYDRIYHTRAKGWSRYDSTKVYYNRPWEKRADELGGTSWEEHL